MTELRTALEAIIEHELRAICGDDNFSADPVILRSYASDLSWLARSWDRLHWPRTEPDFVVWPQTTEQVSAVLKLANRYKVPVVPYCGGAGVQGGTIPILGGIILDVKKMNKLIALDERSLTIRVQTGLMGDELETLLNPKGYTTAHLPQSGYCSGLGGFLAARSAGVLSTKYGKIADMVQGMEVVLPTGQIIHTTTAPNSAAGPRLDHLFMGSEGTLGVITEVTLAIQPVPELRDFRGYSFPTLHDGMEVARKILRRGVRPAAMRLSDEEESHSHYNQQGAFFVIHFDGYRELVDLEVKQMMAIAEAHGGVDLGPEPRRKWWENRFFAAYPKATSKKFLGDGHLYAGKVIDTAGSFDYLEAIHKEMGDAVRKIRGTHYMAHFSHWYRTGGMMYPYVYNYGVEDESELAEVHLQVVQAAVEAILRLGGTINHHHGIGLILAPYMRQEWGEAFDALQAIKRTLDPNNIMNPGKIGFDL